MAKRKREDLEPYDRLVEVLEQEHKGYKSQLVCREVPGELAHIHPVINGPLVWSDEDG
jgi:hypothetical protein